MTHADALTHPLLADETLRQALVEPIIRNIAAGSITTVVPNRRDRGCGPHPERRGRR